jgi:hypothetical protein
MCAVYLRSTRVANAQRCRAPWAGRALQVGGGEVHADDKADFNKTSVLEVLERAAAFCVVRMREVRAVGGRLCVRVHAVDHTPSTNGCCSYRALLLLLRRRRSTT